MKVVTMLIVIMVLFSACSQKVLSSKAECRALESKVIELEKEKQVNLVSKIVNAAANGYPMGVNEVKLNQNIKVLKMKLNECNRE